MAMPTNVRALYEVDRLMRDRIAEADPVGFLCDVCAGKAFRAAPSPGRGAMSIVPTAKMRYDAARVLVQKVLPDLSLSAVDATISVSTHEDSVRQLATVLNGVPALELVKSEVIDVLAADDSPQAAVVPIDVADMLK